MAEVGGGDDETVDLLELEMAHVIYNHRNYEQQAEFLLRRPTPVSSDGDGGGSSDGGGDVGVYVLHYSERQECEAKTVLLAVR